MPETPANIEFSNPSLLYALAWSLVEQKGKPKLRVYGQEFTRTQCLYEIYRRMPTYLPDLRIRAVKDLDDEGILKDFARAVLEAIKRATPEASGPTGLQLEALVDEYQTHLQGLAKDEEGIKRDLLSEQLSLENQLKLIKQYYDSRETIKDGVKNKISPFYREEFRERVAEDVAERLFQEVASQNRAQAPTDEVFVEKAVKKIFQESAEADIAFSSPEKEALTTLLVETITQMNTRELVEGFVAQTELVQTSLPTRAHTIRKITEAGLEPDQATEALNKTEALLLDSRQPTELAVRDILTQTGIPQENIETLLPYVQHYLTVNPIAQAQGQPDPAFISKYALRVAKKLNLTPTTIQHALDGLSVSLLERLQKRTDLSEAQRQLFAKRNESLKALEAVLSQTKGFRFLKLRIGWAQKRAEILNFTDENNPLSPVFYQRHFPDLRNKYLARKEYLQTVRDYFKTPEFRRNLGENPSLLKFFFSPREQLRSVAGGWWNGLLSRSQTLRSFAGFFPKLKPSYFIGRKLGGYLVRKGAAWALKGGLRAAGGKALGFIGSKLLGKATGSLIGTAVGGPLGTVVGFVAGAALGKIINKKNLKRLVALAGAGLAAAYLLIRQLLHFFFANILTTIGTLIGGTIGGLFGGTIGGLFGATAGAKAGHWLSGLGTSLGQAASSAAAGVSNFFSTLTAATVSQVVAASPLIAIGAGAGLTLVTITAKGGAFLPEEIGGGIDAPKQVVTTPDCDHAACKIVAQLKSCGISRISRSNISRVKSCLGSFPQAQEEFERSVECCSNLQCVGFKIGAEKEEGISLPHQNAVSFLDNHPGCEEVSPREPGVGDNAVWGPRKACPSQDPQEASELCSSNIYCCGHIGVITEVGDFVDREEKYRKVTITQAWGNNGQVDSTTITTNKEAGGPWKIISCD